MRNNLFAFVGLLTLICSCGGPREPRSLNNGKVVVIFEDCPLQTNTGRLGGSISTVLPTIAFIDGNGDLVGFEPRLTGRDTLEIQTFGGYAEMRHAYQAIEFDGYLLQEGDTVLVKYDATGRPVLTSIVYEHNTGLYNLPYAFPGAIQDNGYYIGTVVSHSFFKSAFAYFNDAALRTRAPVLEDYLRPRYADLDSLAGVFDRYQAALEAAMDSLYDGHVMDEAYYEYLSHRFFPDKYYTPEEVVQSDSLLHFVSNYYIAQDYLDAVRGATMDSFDRIANDTVALPLARRGILKRLVNRILDDEGGYHYYPKDVKARYVQKYTEITGDSLAVQQILQNATDVASLKSVLSLETPDGQKVSLEDVLAKNKGRVVYVDFWASWCAPCQGQFPYSKALHKRLAGQNIEFVYISIDTNRKAWLNKVREYGDMLAGSYRILEEDADFLKQIRLDKIPRYLIYDRSGKLVELDAPRPSDESAESRLMSFL